MAIVFFNGQMEIQCCHIDALTFIRAEIVDRSTSYYRLSAFYLQIAHYIVSNSSIDSFN